MKDVSLKSTQIELKAWVKHHVPVRGDRILWGKLLTSDMKRKRKQGEEGEDDPEGSVLQHIENDMNEATEKESVNTQGEERTVYEEDLSIQNTRRSSIESNEKVKDDKSCFCGPEKIPKTNKITYGPNSNSPKLPLKIIHSSQDTSSISAYVKRSQIERGL